MLSGKLGNAGEDIGGMKGILDKLWRVPAYLPYLQPSLTPAMVLEVEQKLGVSLPAEYLAVLKRQNGGYVRLTLPDTVHSMIWGIGPHFPNIAEYCWSLDPSGAESGQWLPHDSQRLIPFDGDGHWHLCLDYRVQAEPSVVYVDVETEEDKTVAPTFAAFLAMLDVERSTNEIGVTGKCTVDDVANALEAHLGARFDPAVSDAHGYPIRRCSLGTSKNPQWAWLSPNSVPRGFVRISDKRYSELQHMLPGSSLLNPDFPEVAVFIDCTDAVQKLVHAACARAALPTIPLKSGR